MTEKDVHKCLISFGFYPMTLILKELEQDNRFEECKIILEAMNSYREKFKIVTEYIPTKWSKKFEEEYYSYFKTEDKSLVDNAINYYTKDIKNRLKL